MTSFRTPQHMSKVINNALSPCFFSDGVAAGRPRAAPQAAGEGNEVAAWDASLLLFPFWSWATTQLISDVFFKQRCPEAGLYISFYELNKKHTQTRPDT